MTPPSSSVGNPPPQDPQNQPNLEDTPDPRTAPDLQASPALRLALLVYKRLLSPLLHGFSRLLSPVPAGCRFLPTCSEYAYGALHTHGLLRGGGLALWRLLRCHPFARGGLDPVPPPPPRTRKPPSNY